jgi:4-amino-4-deoxy-L-arabinose transferase-like glycosyltransferase
MQPSTSEYRTLAGFLLLNLVLGFFMTPIFYLGDTVDYLLMSGSFLGQEEAINLAHRSPLYPLLLAGFSTIFEPPVLYRAVVVFQYLLLALTSWMGYLLFREKFGDRRLAILSALLFNLSLSTLYFANILLTEILTVWLMVLSVWFLLQAYEKGAAVAFAGAGASLGLLTLARFNAAPLIVPFLVLVAYALFLQKAPVRKWLISLGAFLIPYLLVVNAWSYYNLQQHGFYGLFPNTGLSLPRNIVVAAALRPGTEVGEEYRPVLEIFQEAKEIREEQMAALGGPPKGSLARFDTRGILSGLYDGYPTYLTAVPALKRHFQLPEEAGEQELNQLLMGFYQEIASQNRAYIFQFRIFSLLSSFRAATGVVLPPEYGNANLNVLPSWLLKGYKLGFLAMSVFVFFAFFYFLWESIRKGWRFDFALLTWFFVVFSFWGINFVFVTVGDANRYKFPAEPFLIGLFVFYAARILGGMRRDAPLA